MTELSNRISVNSGISEFSFEHKIDEELSFSTSNNLRSPSPDNIEELRLENSELRQKVSLQEQLIVSLRTELESAYAKLQHEEAEDQSNDVSEESNRNRDTIRIEKPIELKLPPRSANRAKTPLRSTFSSQDIAELAETSNREAIEEEQSLTKDATEETITQDEPDVLTTPIKSDSNIDWNATLKALSSETTDSQDVTPKVAKSQGTPYSGRIQNSSTPSLNKKSPVTYRTTSGQLSPTSTTSNITEDQSLSRYGSSDTFNRPRDLFKTRGELPASPARSQFSRGGNTPQAVNRQPNAGFESTPTTPMTAQSISITLNNDKPLAKSNLYDPYSGDFQHQQIYQDNNGLGGSYNQGNPYIDQSPKVETHTQPQTQARPEPKHIRYPSDVPLFVDPAHLSTMKPLIISTIHGNPTKKSEDPIITIAAVDRQSEQEIWRFKKNLSQIVQLDHEIRPLINSFSLPPVPEKSLFLTNIPVKVDLRRVRVKDYFLTLFSIPNIPIEASYKIARFMSLDVVNLVDEFNTEVLKGGWLLRRTKGLGNNWKARYCEIDGPFINVYESFGGSLSEIIKLTNCQIGRQPDSVKQSDDKSTFRHAFAVMELKKSGSKSNQYNKHVFCAETDEERDKWVNELVQFADESSSINSSDVNTLTSQSNPTTTSAASQYSGSLKTPLTSPSRHTRNSSRDVSDDPDEFEELAKEARRQKKRSFFPFGKKQNDEIEHLRAVAETDSRTELKPPVGIHHQSNIEKSLQNMNLSNTNISSTVFLNELNEVLKFSKHILYNVEVPSILYRCIKFLIDKQAIYEEGLFRLNGSSALIKHLREVFDKDYDLDFDTLDPKPDINSVAGLLKLWLRELPSNILTRDLYTRFKNATIDITDAQKVSLEFARLTKEIPLINRSVLYVLFKFLNDVIQNKDSNKMNLRNLCIVFSPTLNISSEVIVPFLVDFNCIFEGGEPISNENREVLDINIPTF